LSHGLARDARASGRTARGSRVAPCWKCDSALTECPAKRLPASAPTRHPTRRPAPSAATISAAIIASRGTVPFLRRPKPTVVADGRRPALCGGTGAAAVVALLLVTCAWVPIPSRGLLTHGPRSEHVVALTFDADMTRAMQADLRSGRVRSLYDRAIVRQLRRTRTPATIFLTGLWTLTYPGVVRSLAADPLFELENHSFDHAAWSTPCYGLAPLRSSAAKRAEVLRAARIIRKFAAVEPHYFRFPGGCQSEADVKLVNSLGERPVQWDVVSGDSFLSSPAAVEEQVLTDVRPGSIVVMHLNGAPKAPATAAALAGVIPALRARGFRFVTLCQLFASARTRTSALSRCRS
jgi:peptidoglycan/xylan/chitin deacetylase (PgdA/CDA1 family)